MLPDYPKLKERAIMLLTMHVRNMRLRHSSILPQISTAVQHEGERLAYRDVDGNENRTQPKQFEASVQLTKDEMRQGRFEDVLHKFGEMARIFSQEQEKYILEEVAKSAEAIGNVTDAKGEMTKEHLLESLRKVQWGFDPATGEPQRPELFLSPEALEKYRSRFESWQRDPEFLAELADIEKQQRIDWNDRESRRRLVD